MRGVACCLSLGLPCGQTEGQRAVGHKLAAGESESHAGSWRGICSAKEKATSNASGPESPLRFKKRRCAVLVLYHERLKIIRPFPNTKS